MFWRKKPVVEPESDDKASVPAGTDFHVVSVLYEHPNEPEIQHSFRWAYGCRLEYAVGVAVKSLTDKGWRIRSVLTETVKVASNGATEIPSPPVTEKEPA